MIPMAYMIKGGTVAGGIYYSRNVRYLNVYHKSVLALLVYIISMRYK